MRASVSTLDRSGWTPAQLHRAGVLDVRFDRWKQDAARKRAWEASPAGQAYRDAVASHPLANVIDDQLADGFLEASMRPRRRLKTRDFGNGHKEAVVTLEYPNPRKTLDRAIARDLGHLALRGKGNREENIERAVRAAKQQVRLKSKTMNVNALWTLTYKQNVQDRELVLKHFDAFRRRVVALFGEWRYICVLERQERGAFHIHLATHALPKRLLDGGVKVKSWDVMRRIWRDVAGLFGGNFDEAKRDSRWSGNRKPIKGCDAIAAYIAGYVAKDMMLGELNRKRFSSSKGVDVPKAYVELFTYEDASMLGLMQRCYAAVGDRITAAWFAPQRGVFFLSTDDTGQLSG